jgi:hypothetical protein
VLKEVGLLGQTGFSTLNDHLFMILLLLFFWVVTPFGFVGRCSLLIIGVPFSGEDATVYRQLRERGGGVKGERVNDHILI